MTKYKTKKGDSWIKVANDNGISLRDLFEWNGVNPYQGVPVMNVGQEYYVSNPYRLDPAVATTDALRNYAEYGDQGQHLLTNYALAVKQGKMKFNEVPKEFQSAVNQRMITLGTDKFANHALNVGGNIALFLANPLAYLTGTLAQKGAAYAVDAASGRNEYGMGDVMGYTPVMGREYAQEHPGKAAAVDIATGIIGGGALRNFKNIISSPLWKNFGKAFKANAANTLGLKTNDLWWEVPSNATKNTGHVYKYGTKGVGKSGNKVVGSPSVGYKSVISPKMTFSHSASTSVPSTTVYNSGYFLEMPKMTTMPVLGSYPGMVIPTSSGPEINVVRPERHIFEQKSLDRYQLPNPDPEGKTGEYDPSVGSITITGRAPIGRSWEEQPFLNEHFIINNGYAPRQAIYAPGTISGTPSNIHSGLGYTYDSAYPGNWIVK